MSPLRNTAPAPTQRRHMARVVTALGSAVAAGLTSLTLACADGPTAPTAPAAAPAAWTGSTSYDGGSYGGTAVTTLRWNSAVTQAAASAVIGAAGGSLTLPGGATLVVPRGAVSTNTTFTITRLPGRIVAYDFQPHGRTFAYPLTVRQPGAGTNLGALWSTSGLQGAYFVDQSKLDQANGVATVSEFAPSTTVASDRSSVSFTVKHFSGYLMSTGRK
jgi:hypothetical protein